MLVLAIAGSGILLPIVSLAQASSAEIVDYSDIYFDPGSDAIPTASTAYVLDNLPAALAYFKRPGAKVILKGHAEADLSDQAAKALSQKRAEAVREALLARGISANRIVIIPLGKSDPALDRNGLIASSQSLNQRVQIQFDLP